MHVPVMLAESLQYLAIQPAGVYLDSTAGLGGHTRAIAERLTTGIVLSCDRDEESLELARKTTVELAARIRFTKLRSPNWERCWQPRVCDWTKWMDCWRI